MATTAQPPPTQEQEAPGPMVSATLLWRAGLVAAIGGAANLSSDGYTIKTGMYVALVLLSVGVLANLAMWPFATRQLRVDQAGNVSETPAVG